MLGLRGLLEFRDAGWIGPFLGVRGGRFGFLVPLGWFKTGALNLNRVPAWITFLLIGSPFIDPPL